MTAREAVLAAAGARLWADTAEEGFAAIRALTRCTYSDADLAVAVAEAVARREVRDPVRLLPGALQCCWVLECAAEGSGYGRA